MEMKLFDSELKVMEAFMEGGRSDCGPAGENSEGADRLEPQYHIHGH